MKIATYNVNGVNGRLPILVKWLKESKPDIVCLQELKAPTDRFPFEAIREAGYYSVWKGQKSWNGIAILSKHDNIVEVQNQLPGNPEDNQSRYIEAIVNDIVICCLYLPNGNPYPSEKFEYKLKWVKRLKRRANQLIKMNLPAILIGDFNIIPTENDVYKPEKFKDNALFRTEVRKAFLDFEKKGWIDSLRRTHPDKQVFTFWDYMHQSFSRNAGMRLDHILISPYLSDRLNDAGVDISVRNWEKSSDHAPVWITLKN